MIIALIAVAATTIVIGHVAVLASHDRARRRRAFNMAGRLALPAPRRACVRPSVTTRDLLETPELQKQIDRLVRTMNGVDVVD